MRVKAMCVRVRVCVCPILGLSRHKKSKSFDESTICVYTNCLLNILSLTYPHISLFTHTLTHSRSLSLSVCWSLLLLVETHKRL